MALFMFTRNILAGEPINVFNYGHHRRDFTYIDDIAEGVVRVLDRAATPDAEYDANSPDPARSNAPYRVFNIGNNDPVKLMSFVEAIERALDMPAKKNFLPLQDGDVPATFADVAELGAWTGFKPTMPVAEGVRRFVGWYRDYYKC
jgi:UDP-glucuronate 4-epimerase